MKRKSSFNAFMKGFTLAEVLLTIVVIGVISVITMLIISTSANKQIYNAQYKKMLSTFSEAYNKMISDNSTYEVQDLPVAACTTDAGCIDNEYRTVLNIMDSSADFSFDDKYCHQLSGGTEFCGDYSAVLNDGQMFTHDFAEKVAGANLSKIINYISENNIKNIIFGQPALADSNINSSGIVLGFDINGAKKPNTIGKDVYILNVSTEGQLYDVTEYCKNVNNTVSYNPFIPAAYAAFWVPSITIEPEPSPTPSEPENGGNSSSGSGESGSGSSSGSGSGNGESSSGSSGSSGETGNSGSGSSGNNGDSTGDSGSSGSGTALTGYYGSYYCGHFSN